MQNIIFIFKIKGFAVQKLFPAIKNEVHNLLNTKGHLQVQ